MFKEVIDLGLIGFGTVGTGVVKILQQSSLHLERKIGAKLNLKRIVDRDITSPRAVEVEPKLLTTDVNEILNDPEIEIVVELIGGYEPARTFILEAMNKGKHVVTANKALLACHWDEILNCALRNQVDIYFEASVASGIPIIQALNEGLAANRIESIFGIINGTTNYILTRMAKDKMSFKEALKEAQKKGFAESDPTLDIEGIDSAHKLIILASLAFGTTIKLKDVYIEGISKITQRDIEYANEEFGYVLKLLAIAKEKNGELEVRVHPTLIPQTHLLASVDDIYNAIYVFGDAVGPILFYGKGAGQMPAASAVVSDIMYLARNIYSGVAGKVPYVSYGEVYLRKVKIRDIKDLRSRYYLRFIALDQPGVLASISGILARFNISIASVIQKERKSGDKVPIVMMTHEAEEQGVRQAIVEIDRLPVVKDKTVAIRVEEFK